MYMYFKIINGNDRCVPERENDCVPLLDLVEEVHAGGLGVLEVAHAGEGVAAERDLDVAGVLGGTVYKK